MTKLLVFAIFSFFVVVGETEASETINPKTYVFKKVNSVELKADVYSPSSGTKQPPVIVYLHGGALIFGDRHGQPKSPLLEKLLDSGFAVVSVDYRLAPRTKANEIVEDVEDACKWIRKEGPQLFGVNPNKLIVMGGSAGGYLTLALGHRLSL
ncbi:alpha/beta hydrolase, partial [Planctomycetota bacterium]